MVTRGGGDVADSHLRIPHAERGNRIGLFGGSFNPPHSGHRLVADIALKRLRLDQVWWLVTPGNPLKDHSGLADLGTRVAKVKQLAHHPAMRVTALEAGLGSSFSATSIVWNMYFTIRIIFFQSPNVGADRCLASSFTENITSKRCRTQY